jgi:hypothetical protein
MTSPDIKADAQYVFAILQAGGLAIMPGSMGYIVLTASGDVL